MGIKREREMNGKTEIREITDGEMEVYRLISERKNLFFDNRIEREWLSTKEAASFLSISPNALRIMVHRNQICAFKFGRRLRFRLRDMQALFERRGV